MVLLQHDPTTVDRYRYDVCCNNCYEILKHRDAATATAEEQANLVLGGLSKPRPNKELMAAQDGSCFLCSVTDSTRSQHLTNLLPLPPEHRDKAHCVADANWLQREESSSPVAKYRGSIACESEGVYGEATTGLSTLDCAYLRVENCIQCRQSEPVSEEIDRSWHEQ